MDLLNFALGAGVDGMTSLITSATSILKWAQRLGLIGAALSFCVGGYYLMWGGQSGRQHAKGWFIGGAVGLVVVMGAYGLASGLNNNINFG